MEAHAQPLQPRQPDLHLQPRGMLAQRRLAVVGTVCGVFGGLAMALPLVIYDWVRASHSALELPMAVTAWLFGLNHFHPNAYAFWSIAVGALFLLAYWEAHGLAFTALADRVYRVSSLAGSLALGAVWSFVSFMFFWYMLLPVARDGAPFRLVPGAVGFVAPNWVWILGYTLFGLATGACYWLLRQQRRTQA
jgi:hypothetical protein